MGIWNTIGGIVGGIGGAALGGPGGALAGYGAGSALGNMVDGNSAGKAVKNTYGSSGNTGTLNPGWVNQASQDVYGRGLTAASTPYNYTGQLTAPLSSNQQAAAANAAAQPGRYGQTYSTIQDLYKQSTTPYGQTFNANNVSVNPFAVQDVSSQNFNTSDLSGYIDPYVQGVLNPTLQQLKQTNADQNNQLGLAAGGAGAYGGSREALLESMNNKNTNTAVGNATNQAYSQAFQTAGSLFNQDQNRQLQAAQGNQNTDLSTNQTLTGANLQAGVANQNAQQNAFNTNYNTFLNDQKMKQSAAQGLTSLTGQQASNNNEIMQNLMATGNTQQNTQQAADTANLQDYMTKLQYPMQQTNFLQALLNGNANARSINPSAMIASNNGVQGLLSTLPGLSSIFGGLTGGGGGGNAGSFSFSDGGGGGGFGGIGGGAGDLGMSGGSFASLLG